MSDRKEPTVATPVASPAATGPAPTDPAPETTESTTVPAVDTVTAIPETSPPQYEQYVPHSFKFGRSKLTYVESPEM
jgi:hypothetical protein